MRFAVVGDPVGHSLSPQIHAAAYAALGLDHEYERLHTPLGGFDHVVVELRAGALDGVNVTMPHKDAAFRSVDDTSSNATRTAAVNTITRDEESLIGHNTDVDGVTLAVRALSLDPTTPVTVLGAGGAARAAYVSLESRELTVMARNPERAKIAVDATGVDATIMEFEDEPPESIIVNATPIGMSPEAGTLPDQILANAVGMVEMAYGHGTTEAEAILSRRGVPVADGLVMLVGQAVTAFELFTGMTPPLDVMMHEARRSAS